MYLFFDTETNGLPKNYKSEMKDLENWPRVIQLAWILCDEKRNIISEQKYLISPDNWVVPSEKFWLENGFSTEKCFRDGHKIEKVLDWFLDDLFKAKHLIAHNIEFDRKVIVAEMLRYNFVAEMLCYNKKGKDIEHYCTKLLGTNYCKLPGRYGDFKWPTLTELHTKLFDEGFTGAHDALADVKACMRCYFGLRDAGV
jgi:DNA polymerase III epsilon subunit-like protein